MSMEFNQSYYLANNNDVLRAWVNGDIPSPEWHFNNFGWKEGRNPNATFDTDYYLLENDDVAGAGINPLTHFFNFGAEEGRLPNPNFVTFDDFDTEAYAAENTDLAEAGITTPEALYAHFAKFGFSEDRGGKTKDGEEIGADGIPIPAPTGETFMLTTGVDAGADFTGTDEDDVFNAPLASTPDGSALVQTLQTGDVLDGGEGFNILNAQLADGDPLFGVDIAAAPTISNIQQYNLRSFNDDAILDLEFATGYEQLWNRGSRENLELINVGEVATLGMENVRDGSRYQVRYDDIEVETQVVVADRSGRMADDVRLDIRGVDGNIGTLDLNVSNGVYLELWRDAADTENLIISGEGALRLSGEDEFQNLVTLNATGYNEDLVLDVSGGGNLEEVLTGDGDDIITVRGAAVDGNFFADLGEGENILQINNVEDDDDVNALDFTGGVQNVQTLRFMDDIELDGAATLNLDGFDDALATLQFAEEFDADGEDFTIENAPEDLLIRADDDFDMDGGLFTIEGTVNLTMTSTNVTDDIYLDGGVNSTTLETLTIEGGDDATLRISEGLDALRVINLSSADETELNVDVDTAGELGALETVNVESEAEAMAYFELTGDGNLDALTTVNVRSDIYAELGMIGRAGVAGVQQVQRFAVTGDDPTTGNGQITFTVPGIGTLNVAVAVGAGLVDVRADIEALFDGLSAYEAEIDGGDVVITRVAEGPADQITVANNVDDLDVDPAGFVQGVTPVDGEGFEALETVVVEAGDGNADVYLEDVYGAFTLEVTAGEDADVTLTNTAATSLVVEAVDDADVLIDGALFGNPDLTTVDVTAGGDATVDLEDTSGVVTMTVAAGTDFTYNLGVTAFTTIDTATINVSGAHNDFTTLEVSGAGADVTLEGELDSFTTLDLTGVTTQVEVDATAAEFGGNVQYLIGDTSNEIDLTYDAVTFEPEGFDVSITTDGGNAIREVFSFVGDDIGDVVISGFDVTTAPATRDALDFSAFGNITGAGNLAFTVADANGDGAGDLVIEAADGQFAGSITLLGVNDATFVSNFSIIYI